MVCRQQKTKAGIILIFEVYSLHCVSAQSLYYANGR